MEQRIESLALIFLLLICFFSPTIEGRKGLKQTKTVKHLVAYEDGNNIGSPLFMPPYEDVMGPSSSPNNKQNPLYCVYPPLTPNSPSTTFPTPVIPNQSPPLTPSPPSTTFPTPVLPNQSPPLTPSPPSTTFPTPVLPNQSPPLTPNPPSTTFPTPVLPNQSPPPPPFISTTPTPPQFLNPSPPMFGPVPPSYEPGPPGFGYGPPSIIPSPPEFVPGPPMFMPPVVYPPPAAPPPPHKASGPGLWCVAKPTVPDPIIQEAMNYACGSGADCDLIQPNGACYQPDTLIAHASFAFNSYWQKTKGAGGNCDFGGTAMLITKDPSYDGCQFILD